LLEALFVDFGAERHGFLPVINIEGYDAKIHKDGASLLVVIEKPEKGQKGALVSAPNKLPAGAKVYSVESTKKGRQIALVSEPDVLLQAVSKKLENSGEHHKDWAGKVLLPAIAIVLLAVFAYVSF